MNQKKVLIIVPAPTARGGISNYYQVLRNEFPDNIEYFERGARTWPYRKRNLIELFRTWNDYSEFRKRLGAGDIGIVQTSTSLSLATTIRDGLFIRYAGGKGIKRIVFFRGWDNSAAEKTEKYLPLFKHFFFKADVIITLSEKVKDKLLKWGYRGDIFVETTLVDKSLLINVSGTSIFKKYHNFNKTKCFNLLYLSRVESKKGIYQLLEAFKILTQNPTDPPKYSLTICGDGYELENVKMYIEKYKLKNVAIKGFVEGQKKMEAFESAHLFIFPSNDEGMPNAVLEAMGFGLPILTTPVGGLVDFFIPGEHGIYIEISNPKDIADKVKIMSLDLNALCEMSLNNYKLANEKFRADKVAERIQVIFNNTLSN